ncbi:hypothetical protein Enr13x_68850 [Stieleria neptunia]|uniref:DUF7379 domain-containing protein n=1 Tax=Stieleria neptunia TaxID=2527979 RepID=A0A518I1P3_9BACT|nr:hypothetical protein [Stieleria neptunia]QDV46976.1 hypothetical protein Enr13x_68850 [Stieleria neptunia]
MDGKFLEIARSATAGSSQVRPLVQRPDRTRIRTKAAAPSGPLPPRVRLQLVDDDGILDWEDVTALPPDLGRFRGAPTIKSREAFETLELEFERLPPSKITQFLSSRDEKLTPYRGLRRLDSETKTLQPASFPATGDVLIFVHGTFSNSDNMIAGLLDKENEHGGEFLDQALRRYSGNVFTFDHPTLSVGPILNAWDLQRVIGESDAKIHLVSHSRGGLVSRWWCETFDPQGRQCDKSIFVGSPLAGTGLAAPPNIRETIHLLTQFSRALQAAAGLTALAMPVFSVVEAMLRVVTSITNLAARTPVADAAMAMVPGLFGMSRVGNNPELLRLLETPSPQTDRYYAVRSDFQPSDPAWKFWRMFRKERLVDAAADVLFDGANDLVVDTPSMIDLAADVKIPDSRVMDFGQSKTVHHLNYFYQGDTAKFLGDTLL